MPIILATQEAEISRIIVQSQPKKIVQKYPTQNRVGKIAQVIEHLPSKHEHEALSSNPILQKNILVH
jgi:hypothetical protein